MIVVGDNLKQLIVQHNVCTERDYDGDSIRLSLDNAIRRPIPGRQVAFLGTDRRGCFVDEVLADGRLSLKPHECVLARTREYIRMPPGYLGEIKPTSSTNRDFFSLTLGADYVSPGWQGRLTLEVRNYGPFDLSIPVAAHVGQLMIHRCSDVTFTKPSRYQGHQAPMFTIGESSQ